MSTAVTANHNRLRLNTLLIMMISLGMVTENRHYQLLKYMRSVITTYYCFNTNCYRYYCAAYTTAAINAVAISSGYNTASATVAYHSQYCAVFA
jgi:hypothetical protein